MLYKIETAVRIGMTKTTPTDLPCQWNQSFTKSDCDSSVSEISVYREDAKSKLTKARKDFTMPVSDESFKAFLNSVHEVPPNTVCLQLFENFKKVLSMRTKPLSVRITIYFETLLHYRCQ